MPYQFNKNSDYYVNDSVTVERFKDLGDYHVILIHSHGSSSSVCTGESPTDSSRKTYSADLQAGRIRICGVSGCENRSFYTLNTSFFTTYYHVGNFNNSLLYLGTCDGAATQSLFDAFRSNGVDCVLGYDNHVNSTYNAQMGEMVVKYLCQKDSDGNYFTVEKAVESAKKVLGQTDAGKSWLAQITSSDAAKLKIMGDMDFRLSTSFLSGLVKNGETGFSVSQGRLEYGDGSRIANYDNGYFSAHVKSGSHDYRVSSYGFYTRVVKDVNVNVGSSTYLSDSRLIPSNELTRNQLNRKITGLIQSATTTEPIPNATLKFRNDHNNRTGEVVFTTHANDDGTYQISQLPVGYYTMEVSKSGFITQYCDILVGTGDEETISLSTILSDSNIRIVLTWDENPNDLDSHLIGTLTNGSSYHVYFNHKTQTENGRMVAALDVDDTTSYGPETITVYSQDSTMYYYVKKYAGSGTVSSSGAQIKVYQGDELKATYYVPVDGGSGEYWNVFAVKEGSIITNNTITSYADTSYAD